MRTRETANVLEPCVLRCVLQYLHAKSMLVPTFSLLLITRASLQCVLSCKRKVESLKRLKNTLNSATLGKTPKIFRSDNGREFVSNETKLFFNETPYNPRQNESAT